MHPEETLNATEFATTCLEGFRDSSYCRIAFLKGGKGGKVADKVTRKA